VGDPLPTGWKIVIRRVLPLTQTTRLRNQGGYFAEVQERTFDRLCMQVQQLQEQIDRAFLLPLLGFEGLGGAVPRVNLSETAIEYALGLQGSPGADGAPGPAGPAGPWDFIASHSLTGGSVDIPDIGNSGHVAVMLMVVGAQVATDDTELLLRYDVGGVQTSGYVGGYTTFPASGSVVQSAAPTVGIQIGSSTVGSGISNDGDDACFATIIIGGPHAAGIHKWALIDAAYPRASDGLTMPFKSSGRYAGSTDAITALQLLPASGNFAAGTVYVWGLRAENAKVPVVASQFTPGLLTASQIVLRYVFTEDATIGIDFAGSQASAGVAATAEAVFGISVNGSPGPTMTFAIAGDTATFDNSGADLDVVAGDVLEITAPATPDDTLADLAISIRAEVEIS
jgi:hypothetical protein